MTSFIVEVYHCKPPRSGLKLVDDATKGRLLGRLHIESPEPTTTELLFKKLKKMLWHKLRVQEL